MLVFNRPAFKAGIIVVKEPGEQEGSEITYVFKPKDKGQSFAFVNEAYVLAKYPVLFTQAG